ncbi:MAG: PstS family phosphate ABC transporter substrate-binding protein [Lysinibacillus sp.]
MAEKILAAIMVTMALLFIGVPLGFMALLTLTPVYSYFIFTAVGMLYLIIGMISFGFFKTKRRKQITGIVGVAVLAVAGIPALIQLYEDNIGTVASEINVHEYAPFTEGSAVKTLDEKATLTLEGELPVLDGATAMYPLYSAFVQAVYPENPSYYEEGTVMVSTTPYAYENLFNGEADVIFAAAPSENQIKMAEQRGIELELTPIGREAFVFFVNKKNPVDSLTLEQIRTIYAGESTNWSEVGGSKEDIRAFQRPQDSGSQTALQHLMGDTPIMEAPTEDVVSGMGGIISEVAQYKNYKNAIGYTFRYYSTEMVGNEEIKLLAIDGVAPTKENIRNGTYPIASEFYAVTAGTDNPNVQKLLEWILSPQGQALVEKVGYVPVSE